MDQRVNFFSSLDRPARDWLNLPLVAALSLAVIIVYAGVASMQLLKQRSLHRALADYNSELNDVRTNFNELVSVQQKGLDKNTYAKRINALSADLSVKNSVSKVLRNNQLENKKGFVEPLKALASHPVKGLWFKRIQIRDQEMVLIGQVQRPESFPIYLEKLKAETYFSGKQFKSMKLQQDTSQAWVYNFVLRTSLDDEQEGG